MAKSIVLDAGHGGKDNGAMYDGQVEKEDALRIVLALGQELEKRGIEVFYTRKTDVYQTPFEKAEIANSTDADVFLSIHRNSGINPGEYAGVESLVYRKEGLALELGENINGALGLLGFDEIGVFAEPGIIVLRKTKMPAVLAEIGFINQEEDNRLLYENFQEVVEALADAVQGTLEPDIYSTGVGGFFQVLIGVCQERENAADLVKKAAGDGFPAVLDQKNNVYRITVGRYQELDNAVLMEQALRRRGYTTQIVG